MRPLLAVPLFALLLATAAVAEHADYVYFPPEGEEEEAKAGVVHARLAEWLKRPRPIFEVDSLDEKDNASASKDAGTSYIAAPEVLIDLDPAAFFDAGFEEDGAWHYMAELRYPDAPALRLRVDMGGLLPDESLWVIDPIAPRAFGPYRASESGIEARWLPTISGGAAVLLARTETQAAPWLRVMAVAPFREALLRKAFPCPIEAACVEDETYFEVSTGVACMIIPHDGTGLVLCTGTLLNNPGLAPYVLSAHHCFEGDVDVAGVEVFWDFRNTECRPEQDAVKLIDMPRSYGRLLLADNACLDGQLIELDDVPKGKYGRAWLGWDTRAVLRGDSVAGLHYPMGNPMKTCFGDVIDLNITACLDLFCSDESTGLIQVQWDEGITEQGSSGSGLFLDEEHYRVVGMLSNGPRHDCARPEENTDNFASFRLFYPQIACYLDKDGQCEAGIPCEEKQCFLESLFGSKSWEAEQLRAIRDGLLAKSRIGRRVTETYYRLSDKLGSILSD